MRSPLEALPALLKKCAASWLPCTCALPGILRPSAVLEYPLNVAKLYWSRWDIMHVTMPGTINHFYFWPLHCLWIVYRVLPNGGWTSVWQATDSKGVALRQCSPHLFLEWSWPPAKVSWVSLQSRNEPKLVSNSFFACPGKGWDCAVESSVLTTYIPIDLVCAVNSFLTGGRQKYFLALLEEEQTVELEKAYARATVAVTKTEHFALSAHLTWKRPPCPFMVPARRHQQIPVVSSPSTNLGLSRIHTPLRG